MLKEFNKEYNAAVSASEANAARRAASDNANIQTAKRLEEMQGRLDALENNQAKSDKLNRRLAIATLIAAILAVIVGVTQVVMSVM